MRQQPTTGSGVGRAIANLFSKNGSVDVVPERVKLVVNEIDTKMATGMVRDLSKKVRSGKDG